MLMLPVGAIKQLKIQQEYKASTWPLNQGLEDIQPAQFLGPCLFPKPEEADQLQKQKAALLWQSRLRSVSQGLEDLSTSHIASSQIP